MILDDDVDLMLVSSTPLTTNPVSDVCEANGMPCIATVVPWQPWFFGRKGDPGKPFKWTYQFFWGLEDIIAVFLDMWSQVETNKVVGALYPNDADGAAWGDTKIGFPPPLKKLGYRLVDPGLYPNLTTTSRARSRPSRRRRPDRDRRAAAADFTTFWKQALQQGFRPKIASVGKALLFPSSVEALGELGEGMSTEVWWSPPPVQVLAHGPERAAARGRRTRTTGKQWTQPLGSAHALFEVARTSSRGRRIDDKEAIRAAIKATKLNTIFGRVAWEGGGQVAQRLEDAARRRAVA